VRVVISRLAAWVALIAACLCVPAMANGGGRDAPQVASPAGALQGEREGGIVSYKGIPYAVAPEGKLRWKPPVPAPDWDGVRDATEFGPACYQPRARGAANSIYYEDIGEMSEDCLSLNVWAPKDAENAPVFVWIHGGALVSGASHFGMYDGTTLAEEGVVVVSINYRLGVLGFLAHPELSAESDDGISGNYGLMDQIEALRWIERNIAAFGGDPDNVTIAGESAGALSVMWLMTAPPARGLFDKAIMQSAYMISSPELKEAAHGHFSAEAIGTWLQGQLEAGGIGELREMQPARLVDKATAAGFLTWSTVDGKLIPHQIAETFDRGEQAPVPILAGFNSGEIRSLRRLLPEAPGNAEDYETAIRAAYGDLADEFLTIYPSDSIDESMLATTRDALYGWTAERLAKKQTALGQDAYLYLFDHGYPAADKAGLHAFHASEIPYVFGTMYETTKYWPRIPRSEAERRLSAAMVDYWTTFARSGAPQAERQPDWPEYGEQGAFVAFEEGPVVAAGLMGGRYRHYEEVVCRRRAAGDVSWHWNVGIASPPLPPQAPGCR